MAIALIGACALYSISLAAPAVPGDAERGKELFRSLDCVRCHPVDGVGGGHAPDLARPVGRGYTPAAMAALMWNHAPLMWAAMAREGVATPRVTAQQAADLFAFFYAARYFDLPGDAARGKQAFQTKRCAACHGLASPVNPVAKPVSGWETLRDPIALAEQMWNHAAQMKAETAQRDLPWPRLSSQELTDIVLYLQSMARLRRWPTRLSAGRSAASGVSSAEAGEMVFNAKGCALCHRGSRWHAGQYTGRSLTDFAAALWNHAPRMAGEPPALSYREMRNLVGYLWTLQIFDHPGDPGRGKRVFTTKHCSACHGDGSTAAPDLTAWKGRTHAFAIVEALWQHGPRMLNALEQKGLAWPRFTTAEIRDITAYLNDAAR